MNQKTQNFLDLFFEAIDENIDEVVEELKSAGIDPEETQIKILHMIKEKKSKLKIERGRKLQSKVAELIKKKTIEPIKSESEAQVLAIAARKLDKLSEEDIKIIKKDTTLLDDIEKLIAYDKNNQA